MKGSALVFGLLVCSLASLFTNSASQGTGTGTTASPLDFSNIISSLKDLFNSTSGSGTGGGLGDLGSVIGGLLNKTTGSTGGLLDGLGNLLGNGGGLVGNLLKKALGGLTGQPKQNIFQKIIGFVKNILSKVAGAIKGLVNGILAIPQKLFGFGKNKSNSTQPITSRAGFLGLGGNSTKSGSGLLGGLGSALGGLLGGKGGGGLGGIFQGITGTLGKVLGGLTGPLKGLLGGGGFIGKIISIIKNILNTILKPVKALLAALTGGNKTATRRDSSAGSLFQDLLNKIISELQGLINHLEGVLLNLSFCCIQKASPGQLRNLISSCLTSLSTSLNTQVTQDIASLTCNADTGMPTSDATISVADSDISQYKTFMQCIAGVEETAKAKIGP